MYRIRTETDTVPPSSVGKAREVSIFGQFRIATEV